VPSPRAGPPDTLSAVEYGNLIRAPRPRSLVGKRDHALLRLMGDFGLCRSEVRGLTMRAIRQPRANLPRSDGAPVAEAVVSCSDRAGGHAVPETIERVGALAPCALHATTAP